MNRADRFDGKTASADTVAASDATASCGIAFMAKASAPGRAKTRLVPPLTFEEAAALNTAFLCDVADNVLLAAHHAGPHAGIAGYAAYGPTGAEDFFRRTLPGAIGLIGAWWPDFGDCLFHTIEQILGRGHGSAVVLNSDSPTLPTAFLIETAAVLARPGDRAVLGPSHDGGYYLLGLKAAHRRMFDDIAWSTERVAEQTQQRARDIGLEVHTLPVWYDVDEIDGLRRLYDELGGEGQRRPDTHPPHYAVQTAKLLGRLWRDHDFGGRIERVMQIDEVRA
ncbi:MAG: TIGR04282 family arsenosugar biosynthesis glycosyltransferase [Xanthobacteraceae bacterium]